MQLQLTRLKLEDRQRSGKLSKTSYSFKSNIYIIVGRSVALHLTAPFQLSVLLWARSLCLGIFVSSVPF